MSQCISISSLAYGASDIVRLLAEVGADVSISTDVSAEKLTSFGIGGPVACLLEPQDVGSLLRLVGRFRQADVPFKILGAGSNIIVRDSGLLIPTLRLGRGFAGVVPLTALDHLPGISVNPSCGSTEIAALLGEAALKRCSTSDIAPSTTGVSEDWLVFGATPLMALSRGFSAQGLSGLEFAAGIPGSLGGGVFMNAGAHGSCMSNVVQVVYYLNEAGEPEIRRFDEMQWSYRKSGLPSNCLILAAILRLGRKNAESCLADRSSCLDYRRATQPLSLPSSGSLFRNPSPESLTQANLGEVKAGWLLEQVGLKGRSIRGVAYSEKHANWLVKIGPGERQADAALELIELGQKLVFERFGVSLELEVVVW